MPKTNTWAADVLGLFFQAASVTSVAINATSSPLTSLYVSLHTASPGVSGNQTTNEAAYTSYARVAVVRTSSGWALSGETVSPVANITFPTATGGSETETYWGIGSASTGTGTLYYFGTLSPTVAVSSGVAPILTTASTIVEA